MVTKQIEKDQNQNLEDENDEENLPKDVYVIAQEIKIVKSLASHDSIQRGKALRKLEKWLKLRTNCSFPFTEEDFLRLWKGLYFCMWMCDKPLNQENLADDLGKLLKCFNNTDISIQFFGAFLKTMGLEWFGIDQWRMDKFMMLIRRIFRAIFHVIRNDNWTDKNIDLFNTQLLSTVLSTDSPVGLTMHVMDVYLEELAKVSNGEIPAKQVTKFIQPFIYYLVTQKEFKLLGYARNRVFYHLLWQSELGRDYTEKYNAWKEMGFPTETIHELEKVEVEEDTGSSGNEEEEEEEEEMTRVTKTELDPRAGNVDVFIPALPVDAKGIVNSLEEIQYTEATNTKSRRFLRTILEKYKIFETGEFPLGVKKIPKLKLEAFDTLIEKKVEDLDNLEDTLYGTTRKLKKLNKKKRRKLLSSLDLENLNEETFEEALKSKIEGSRKRKHSLNDEWIEEEIIPSSLNNTQNDTESSKKKNKKKKNLKQQKPNDNNKIEKENHSNAVNHNGSLSSNINDWVESENVPTPQKSKIENKNKISKQISKEDKNIKLQPQQNQKQNSDWDKPLENGEIEYFVPSRKLKLKHANSELKLNKSINGSNNSTSLVLNPFAKKTNKSLSENTNKQNKGMKKAKSTTLIHQNQMTTPQQKKVKIVLQKNTIQKPSDYIQQVRSSPQVPYDAGKVPAKGLLKPNLTPSPINPFYKKKIGLKFNESF